jgi:hypothetical protein
MDLKRQRAIKNIVVLPETSDKHISHHKNLNNLYIYLKVLKRKSLIVPLGSQPCDQTQRNPYDMSL